MTTREADGLAEGMQRPDGARRHGERWMGYWAAQQGLRGQPGPEVGRTGVEREGYSP